MNKTLKEWKEYTNERCISRQNISRELVFGILSDWEESNNRIADKIQEIFESIAEEMKEEFNKKHE